MSNFLLSGKELSAFPTPGHILATLFLLAGLPRNVSSTGSCRLSETEEIPVVRSCWEGGSCGPMAPSRGHAQDDSHALLLKVRSPLARNVSPLLRQLGSLVQAKQLYVWGPTCVEKN